MDEFVDQLLNDERVCDLILPRLTKRDVLEELGDIGPRKSRLLDAMEGKSERERSGSMSRSTDRSRAGARGVQQVPGAHPGAQVEERVPPSLARLLPGHGIYLAAVLAPARYIGPGAGASHQIVSMVHQVVSGPVAVASRQTAWT